MSKVPRDLCVIRDYFMWGPLAIQPLCRIFVEYAAFELRGEFICSFDLVTPKGVSDCRTSRVSPNGNIYTLTNSSPNIYVFDPNGNFIRSVTCDEIGRA